MDVGNLISGSSAFSKSSLYTWKFLVHVLLKPSLEDFKLDLPNMWNECNCSVVWTFFNIALLRDWNENWPFPVLWPLLSFPNSQIIKLDGTLKSRDITLPTNVHLVKAMAFLVVMYGCLWELDHKEGWTPKNWCFQTVVLEKTLESPLDYEIKPVNPKGNQHLIFIGRTNVEAKVPTIWPPDAKIQLIGKDYEAGKDWGQEKKAVTGWDGRMKSLTQWTWVWPNSGR